MSTRIDLKQIEEKTRASYFEDGFWDIGLGLAVLAMTLAVSLWFSAGKEISWWWFFLPPAIAVVPAIARRYITYPRTGQAKLRWMPLGNQRRKLSYVACVATSMLLIYVGLLLYALSDHITRIPDVAGGFILGTGWLLFFVTFGYFWRYRVTYAYGVLMAVSSALAVSKESAVGEIVMYASGALMVLVGLTRTVRFFRKYPKKPVKDINANGPS